MTTVEATVAAPDTPRKMSREERRTLMEQWRDRTFKREIACLGLFVWLIMTIAAQLRYHMFPPADPAMLAAMGSAFGSIYTIATTMIFVFAGAAFGIDAYAKQIK